MHRLIIPLLFGIAGVAILVWLGMWQVQRLAWKEGVLAEIDARIVAAPVALPATPDPQADRYLPVSATGTVGPDVLRVLVSRKQVGAGYRLITRLETDTRPVLLDLGFIKVDQPLPPLPEGALSVTGNLHWPDDRNSSTPDNDPEGNLWFARDLDQMAQALNTEPVLVVAREISVTDLPVTPLPVDSASISNDHLEYAITWFSLAVIWAIMTFYFLWRTRRPNAET